MVYCLAKTKAGKSCKRKVAKLGDLCGSHKDYVIDREGKCKALTKTGGICISKIYDDPNFCPDHQKHFDVLINVNDIKNLPIKIIDYVRVDDDQIIMIIRARQDISGEIVVGKTKLDDLLLKYNISEDEIEITDKIMSNIDKTYGKNTVRFPADGFFIKHGTPLKFFYAKNGKHVAGEIALKRNHISTDVKFTLQKNINRAFMLDFLTAANIKCDDLKQKLLKPYPTNIKPARS